MIEITVDQIIPYTQRCLVQHPLSIAYLNQRKITNPQLVSFGIGCSGDEGFIIKELDKKVYPNLITLPVMDEYGVLKGILTRKIISDGSSGSYFMVPLHEEVKHVLFGFRQAIRHIYQTGVVLLTEGSFDTLAIQTIIPQSCALLTASLSEKQAQTLRRYADRIIYVPDNDATGNAMAAKFQQWHGRNFKVNVVRLSPGYKDPSRWRQDDPESAKDFWVDVKETYFD